MATLFTPARLLMGRMRYPIKFAFIFTLVLIPMVVLGALLYVQLHNESQLTYRERQGIDYVRHVRPLLEHVARHRGMAAAFLNGDASFRERLLREAGDIDESFASLARFDETVDTWLGSGSRLAAIREQWSGIKKQVLTWSPADSFKAHTETLGKVIELITYIADKTNLTLDPQLDTSYLNDAIVNRLPLLVESMGQVRGLGASIAARKSITQAESLRLAVLLDRIGYAGDRLAAGLRDAANYNPVIDRRLRSAIDTNNTSLVKIRQMVNDQILEASAITIEAKEIFTAATAAIQGGFNLFDEIVPAVEDLFAQRQKQALDEEILTIGMIVGVLLVVSYLFVGFYLSVKEGVVSIGEATRRLAAGDLTARVTITSRDELHQVGEDFTTMAEKMETAIREIVNSTTQLASSSEEVAAVSRDSATNVERQRSDTEQVAAAINEMAATVQEVAQNTTAAANSTRSADEETREGLNVVQRTAEAITRLSDQVEDAAQVIGKVADESEHIGAVLDVIKGVAEQTNLLALNAAIEAARAGEQGRGFAVVADEVRGLANRTQQSASEIEHMIDSLQDSAKQAVSLMQQSREQARGGVEQTGFAAQSLQTIAKAVSTINDMNTQVASAAEEQRAVSDDINRNIANISEISNQTATGATQLIAASESLAQLAAQLHQAVNRFKIG